MLSKVEHDYNTLKHTCEFQQKEYSLITADYEQKQFELTTKYCASIKAILSASDYNKFLAINPYCTQTTMFSF